MSKTNKRILGTAIQSMEVNKRLPGIAQQNASATQYLPYNLGFGGRSSIHFDTPESEAAEAARAAAEEAQAAKVAAIVKADIKKQLDGISQTISRMSKAPKETEDVIEDDKKEPIRKSAADKAIEARFAVIEKERADERAASLKIARDAALVSSSAKLGITDWQEEFIAHVERHHGGNIAIDKTTGQVVYKESEFEQVPLSEWLAKQDAEKKFNKYKPAPVTPTKGPRSGVNPGGAKLMTRAEFKQAMLDGVQGLDKIQQLAD